MRETLPFGGHHIFDKLVARRLMAFYERIARRRPDVRDIVDLGCGPGHLVDALAAHHPDAVVVGIDLDPQQVRIAKRQHPERRYQVGASHESGLPDDSVDWVLATETFHHWSQPEESMVEVHRILRPGGEFWIVEGSGDMSKADLEAWTGRKPLPGLTWWVRWIFSAHGYREERLQSDVVALAEASPFRGCSVEREDGWWIVVLRKA